MINPREAILEQQRVRVDWRAYWKEFSRVHGDFPVKYRGRFLFRDGWTYAQDYPGPEWPPPQEPELGQVIRAYWILRKRQVRQEWWEKDVELRQLRQLQSTRQLPLMHRSVWLVRDEDGTPRRRVFEGPVDFPMLEAELEVSKRQLDECNTELAKWQTLTVTARSL